MRVTRTVLGLGLTLAVATTGCGSNDCAETATCDPPADGSAGSDVVGVDAVGMDAGDASPGTDATTGGDSSTGTDAMTVPDVVFVDSASCPTGSQCVDPVPTGWSGPLILSDQTSGPPAPTAPACPSSYSTDAYDGNGTLSAPAATCGCSCGTLTSAGSCNSTTPLGVELFTSTDCSGTACDSAALPYSPTGFCVGTGCSGVMSARVQQATPENGTCTAAPSQTIPPWAWSETARACQPASVGGGCSASQVCVPTPPSPFQAQLCILQSGDVACPAGSTYSVKHTFYGSTMDSRACSMCSCGEATGGTCSGGTVIVASEDTGSQCGGMTSNIPTDGNCYPVSIGNGNAFAEATAVATASGGTCAPMGGTATGAVTPAEPTTICCQP
jgi:hypothetical protein